MKRFLFAGIALFVLTAAQPTLAADRPIYKAPPVVDPIFNWTGFYVGVNAGGAFGTAKDRLTVPAIVNGVANNVNAAAAAEFALQGNGSHTVSGFTGGLTAGYNYQMGSVVIGVEGDIDYLNLRGSRAVGGLASPFTIRTTDSTTSNWMGTARVRLGHAFDRALLYVTGGAAFTDARFQRFVDDTVDGCLPAVGGGFGRCHSGSARFNTGWTVGGGLAFAINNNWSVKGEYLYSNFGHVAFRTISTAFVNQGLDHSSTLQLSTIRIGFDYRF